MSLSYIFPHSAHTPASHALAYGAHTLHTTPLPVLRVHGSHLLCVRALRKASHTQHTATNSHPCIAHSPSHAQLPCRYAPEVSMRARALYTLSRPLHPLLAFAACRRILSSLALRVLLLLQLLRPTPKHTCDALQSCKPSPTHASPLLPMRTLSYPCDTHATPYAYMRRPTHTCDALSTHATPYALRLQGK